MNLTNILAAPAYTDRATGAGFDVVDRDGKVVGHVEGLGMSIYAKRATGGLIAQGYQMNWNMAAEARAAVITDHEKRNAP